MVFGFTVCDLKTLEHMSCRVMWDSIKIQPWMVLSW